MAARPYLVVAMVANVARDMSEMLLEAPLPTEDSAADSVGLLFPCGIGFTIRGNSSKVPVQWLLLSLGLIIIR